MVLFHKKLVLLQLCSLLAVSDARDFIIKKNHICSISEGKRVDEVTFKTVNLKEKKNGSSLKIRCADKCRNKPGCKAFVMMQTGKEADCKLLKAPIISMNTNTRLLPENPIDKNKDNKNDKNKKDTKTPKEEKNKKNDTKTVTFCGMRRITNEPTIAPTDMPTISHTPTDSPSTFPPTDGHGRIFITENKTECKRKGDKPPKKLKRNFYSEAECQNVCGFKKKCKAFQYNTNNMKCLLFNYRVTKTKSVAHNSSCGREPEPTPAPFPPTKSPVQKPTNAPITVKQVTCKLKVTNGFPFESANDAPYYGSHADWVEVHEEDNPYDYCSGLYEAFPPWCSYTNSGLIGDSAYVENVEDYYYENPAEREALNAETFVVEMRAGVNLFINSYHYFFSNNYYADIPEWNDHAMSPEVKIFNLSNQTQDQIGATYKHPAKNQVSTHIDLGNETFQVNPKYEGNMEIGIQCSEFCWCTPVSFRVFAGDYFY